MSTPPVELQFAFPLPNGLHARPASHLEEAVRSYRGSVTFINDRTGRSASVRSVLGLVGTETRHNDPCRMVFSGGDAEEAKRELSEFLRGAFLRCDEPLLAPASNDAATPIPRSLSAAGLGEHARGVIACAGIGRGTTVICLRSRPPQSLLDAPVTDIPAEQRRVEDAFAVLRAEMERQISGAKALEAAVLKAHLAIVRDEALLVKVMALLSVGRNAAAALTHAFNEFAEPLRRSESLYVRERVIDLEDVCTRLLSGLYGDIACEGRVVLHDPSVIVAESLTPSQFLALDRSLVRGLALGHAGATSHTVILARSFGIPTLTGLHAAGVARAGEPAVVDAETGVFVPVLTPALQRYYARAEAKLKRMALAVSSQAHATAATHDGRRLEVAANISLPEEAGFAFANGAEGVGLFRTEMLFLDREAPPSEAEQFAAYASVVRAAEGRPVIIRTIDLGGDKPAAYLALPSEHNPFLGYRAVRFYPEFKALLRTQLRAILRAAMYGTVKIMVPMVSRPEEVRWCRGLIAEVRKELAAERITVPDVPVGIMVEVPSAAYLIDDLCAEVDFLSVGTNDLLQYFFAVDRENAQVASLYTPFHPGFLRLLDQLVTRAHEKGRWIGLCGELGENATALPLLVGLGFDEISLGVPRIAATKAALARLNATACTALAGQARRCSTLAEVQAVLTSHEAASTRVPLLTPELVVLQSASQTREEVIREAVDALQLAGRTAQPALVEEAIWRREEVYATSFDQGLAIPHCKTDAVTSSSIVIVRPTSPVEWGAAGSVPVKVAILLAVPERQHGKEHMRIFARLSRLVMRDEFRELLSTEAEAATLVSAVEQHLELGPASAATS